MRIDSSGNLLVGKTDSTDTNLGCQIENDGKIKTTTNGQSLITLNRKTSDGSIAIFQKDGSTVGNIGTTSGDLNIYSTASGHKGLRFGIGYIAGTNNAGATEDAGVDLGWSSGRFKDLYL